MTWQTNSIASAETEQLGQELGKLLKPPAVIELCSDLGGGKTTFVRGLARGLGSKDTVTSPTFTLNQIYKAHDGVLISHHDFYRLSDAGILSDELAESLQDDRTVTVVEWGDIVENVLPKDRLAIIFKPVADNTEERQITFNYYDKFEELIKNLETAWLKSKP